MYCFIKCLHPHFHTKPFPPNALSSSSSCSCSCMRDSQHVHKPQRLAEGSRTERSDLVCVLFLIRAGLVKNGAKVDGWLDQHFIVNLHCRSCHWQSVECLHQNRKIKKEGKNSFKGSARASSTVAGHAITPPASVTRISTFDKAHKKSGHRKERPASHVEGSFQIFFKTQTVMFSQFSSGKSWKT